MMSNNRVQITRRQEVRGYIRIEPSFNDPNRLFISTPNIVELSEEETYNFLDALAEEADKLWGNK